MFEFKFNVEFAKRASAGHSGSCEPLKISHLIQAGTSWRSSRKINRAGRQNTTPTAWCSSRQCRTHDIDEDINKNGFRCMYLHASSSESSCNIFFNKRKRCAKESARGDLSSAWFCMKIKTYGFAVGYLAPTIHEPNREPREAKINLLYFSLTIN